MSNNIECPSCHFKEHLDDAVFCQSCGIQLSNYCKNPDCDTHKDEKRYPNVLPANANYCPYCGSETTYYDYLCR